MSSEVLKIDLDRDPGLHELAHSQDGHFQLRFAKERTEYILSHLDGLVHNTVEKAPLRIDGFCLDRVTDREPTREEDKWERAMHRKWGPGGSGEYVPVCKRIQAYQYPLCASQEDRSITGLDDTNACWGEIDLLGIGVDCLPVPNELKKRKTNESPLRMLLQAAAYGFAIRKVWPKLKDHWVKALCWLGQSPSQFPENLDKVTLIGVAPTEYWCRCLGLLADTNEGKFPPEAWPAFWQLVDRLEKWFNIYFVAVEGCWQGKQLPIIITDAQVLDLRSLTLDPAVCRDALMEAYQRTVHHSPSTRH